MPRTAAFAIGGALATLLAACAAVLGIEELPVVLPNADAASESALQEFDACGAPVLSFCAQACPRYDFCDDFEGQNTNFDRWKTPALVPKPFTSGVFQGRIEIVDSEDPARGSVLSVSGRTDQETEAVNGLITRMEFPVTEPLPVAIESRALVRLVQMDVEPDSGAGPQEVGWFAVGAPDIPLPLVRLEFRDEGNGELSFSVKSIVFPTNQSIDMIKVEHVPRATFEHWASISLDVGLRSALEKDGITCRLELAPDPGDDAGPFDAGPDPIVAVARAPGFVRCAAVGPTLQWREWLRTPVLFAGVGVGVPGTVQLLFDDVAARRRNE